MLVTFPLPASAHRPDVEVAAQLRAAGFVRAQLDGAVVRLDADDAERRVREAAEVLVVVDRLAASEASRGRLADAVATAFNEGEGIAVGLANGSRRRFSEHPACSRCGTPAPVLTPALFSFNNPRGACPTCNGFGAVLEYDEALIVPHPERSLREGALSPWTMPRYDKKRRALAAIKAAEPMALPERVEDLKAERDKLIGEGYTVIGTTQYTGKYPEAVELKAQAKRIGANRVIYSTTYIPPQPGSWNFSWGYWGGSVGTGGSGYDVTIVFLGR